MEIFDAVWLALREPIDGRSRAELLLKHLYGAWEERGWTRILDLGSGTGANFRYLAPRLPGEQVWVLLDHDRSHTQKLARLQRPALVSGLTIICGDVAEEGLTAVQDTDLVTASAMLDLVSEGWLQRIVSCCLATGCGAYFPLNYNGGINWLPKHATESGGNTVVNDNLVREAVNTHQLTDKGLGPALGPLAVQKAERLFRDAGYWTLSVESPWLLGSADAPMVRRLLEGWVSAVADLYSGDVSELQVWADERLEDVSRGRCILRVGHSDLLALPPGRV